MFSSTTVGTIIKSLLWYWSVCLICVIITYIKTPSICLLGYSQTKRDDVAGRCRYFLQLETWGQINHECSSLCYTVTVTLLSSGSQMIEISAGIEIIFHILHSEVRVLHSDIVCVSLCLPGFALQCSVDAPLPVMLCSPEQSSSQTPAHQWVTLLARLSSKHQWRSTALLVNVCLQIIFTQITSLLLCIFAEADWQLCLECMIFTLWCLLNIFSTAETF